MASTGSDLPDVEDPEPFEKEDADEIGPLDSEIDFDDERDDDQLPLDVVEAIEVGALLDDPEMLDEPEGL